MAVFATFAFFAIFGGFFGLLGYSYGQDRGYFDGWNDRDYQRDHAEALEINAKVDAERYRERNNAHAEALQIDEWVYLNNEDAERWQSS